MTGVPAGGSGPAGGGVAAVVEGVSAGYGLLPWRRTRSLRDLGLEVPAGSVTALVGPNGAGKTTLMRLLLGFLDPWAGRVVVGGVRPAVYRRRHGVGYLPEALTLPRGWTVEALVAEGGWRSGLRGADHAEGVRRALEATGMTAERSTLVTALSRGKARRATLAFALVGDPGLVLLDEPWAGLDPRARGALRENVESLTGRGATVVLASHELAEVAGLVDRVVVLDDGRPLALLEGAEITADRMEELLDVRRRMGRAS